LIKFGEGVVVILDIGFIFTGGESGELYEWRTSPFSLRCRKWRKSRESEFLPLSTLWQNLELRHFRHHGEFNGKFCEYRHFRHVSEKFYFFVANGDDTPSYLMIEYL
jgi:hypothetical protein